METSCRDLHTDPVVDSWVTTGGRESLEFWRASAWVGNRWEQLSSNLGAGVPEPLGAGVLVPGKPIFIFHAGLLEVLQCQMERSLEQEHSWRIMTGHSCIFCRRAAPTQYTCTCQSESALHLTSTLVLVSESALHLTTTSACTVSCFCQMLHGLSRLLLIKVKVSFSVGPQHSLVVL